VVSAANTATSLSATATSTTFGDNITFSASVSPVAPGAGTLTGSITFSDGNTVLAVVPLSGNSASFSDSSLTAGGHIITATYSGDVNFNASTSSPVNVTVKPLAGDLTTLQS
jgi:hypothetical protein